MIGLAITLTVLAIPILIGIAQYKKNPKPPNGLTYEQLRQYYYYREWENPPEDEPEDIAKAERIAILDETIIKYQRLLDTLTAQYKNTYNESEKAKILSKQISTMEKLTRALEKRERLE